VTTEAMLIAAITALAGVISFLWMAFFHPLIKRMLTLIDTLNTEQPKQTRAIEDQSEILSGQTEILKEIASTATATKHQTAEHLRNQAEDRTKLSEIHGVVARNVCQFVPKPGGGQ
jgi:hypothetical protein